ncbi:MAG: hypothetical protein ACYSWU_07840 [Planctomycetota bacterium]|jgi:hypothetical protein
MRQLIVVLIVLVGLALAATAANADTPKVDPNAVPVEVADEAPADTSAEPDAVGTIEELVGAIRNGNWRMVAALGLVLLMLVLGKVRHKVGFFKGDRGGAILLGVLSLGGALIVALQSDAPLDWKLFLGALGVMWTAAGGYNWFKRIIWPKKDTEPDPDPEPEPELEAA